MPNFPLVFPLWWVALTGLASALVSVGVVRLWFRSLPWRDVLELAGVVGLSVFLWRWTGNIKDLNDDPAGVLSPNDLLSPAITWVCLNLYGTFRHPIDVPGGAKARAAMTLVVFAVNVVTI